MSTISNIGTTTEYGNKTRSLITDLENRRRYRPFTTEEADSAIDSMQNETMTALSLIQMYGIRAFQEDGDQDDNPMKTLPERLASILIELSVDQSGIIQPLDFQSLAHCLGTQRETIGAILRAFGRQGLIQLGYQRMRILDLDSLHELAVS